MMDDEYSERSFAWVASMIVLVTVGAFIFSRSYIDTPSYTSSVLVTQPLGSGSGVHIGDGYIVTAAHVVDGAESVKVTSPDSGEQSAEVMWSSSTYDVALLRVHRFSRIGSSGLSCRTLETGEEVSTRGNPLRLRDITSWGRVAGEARVVGSMPSAVPVDMTIAPGNSGGGVFDSRGDVVGIAVAVAIAPQPMGYSLTGFGFIVPGSAICALMGRTA